MPGGRRAPPPPPSDGPGGPPALPPPLPSRKGLGSSNKNNSGPPPLPSTRPPAALPQQAEDTYEEMNGGFPIIIDAKPTKRSSAVKLSQSFNSSSISRPGAPKTRPPTAVKAQSFNLSTRPVVNSGKNKRVTDATMRPAPELPQESLEMEDTYEMPANESLGIPPNQFHREKQETEDEDDEGWSSTEFDDVAGNSGSESDGSSYMVPDGSLMMGAPAEPDSPDVYEHPDGEAFFNQRKSPLPSPKFPFGAAVGQMALNAATLQIGKLKLNNAGSQGSTDTVPSQKPVAQSREKPKPPPKPRGNLIESLAKSLNQRALDKERKISEQREHSSDENSSTGSLSSQLAGRENKPLFPPESSNNPKIPQPKTAPIPPKKPVSQNTVKQPDEEEEDLDQIYDDCDSNSDPLWKYDWYHKVIDRKEATKRIRSIGETGTFLIREKPNSDSSHRYTLVVLKDNKVHNLIIRERDDGTYALGDKFKPEEVSFPTVNDLVIHHQKNFLRLLKEQESLVKLLTSPKCPERYN